MELCYTLSMNDHQHIWRTWADSMRKLGINDFIAAILEAAGPLTILAAQFIYLGQPLVVHQRLYASLTAMAGMLEDTQETQAFICLLREESQREPA
jgi:hypothetical protein